MIALAPGFLQPVARAMNSLWKPFFVSLIQAQGDMSKVPGSVEQSLEARVKQPRFRPLTSYESSACRLQPSDR
jgi:hypothetical protein